MSPKFMRGNLPYDLTALAIDGWQQAMISRRVGIASDGRTGCGRLGEDSTTAPEQNGHAGLFESGSCGADERSPEGVGQLVQAQFISSAKT
jgi:hypothetical protein